MANYIVVLTHKRPECLWLCLESLRRCRGIEKYPLYVAMNEDSDPEIPDVVRKLWQGLPYQLDIRPPGWLCERANGEAMKVGSILSRDFFIVLGEDEEVSADFLELVEYVSQNLWSDRLFSFMARGVRLPRDYRASDVGVVVMSGRFLGVGMVIFKEAFESYVKEYLCEEYYQSEVLDHTGIHDYNNAILQQWFPREQLGPMALDGLIEQVIKVKELYTLCSLVPRSHEIGFYGVHMRTLNKQGIEIFRGLSLEVRVAFLREGIKTGSIKELFGLWSANYWPIDDDHSWSELRVRSEGMY